MNWMSDRVTVRYKRNSKNLGFGGNRRNPRKESTKNSSNREIENRAKNTSKNHKNKKHCSTR
jgi:hypothetical protein